MTTQGIFQIAVFLAIVVALTRPLGGYLMRVAEGERHVLTPVLGWLERSIYAVAGVDPKKEQSWLTYAVGMLALCGFPLFFSGFWSKDAILHAASTWSVSRVPFYLGAIGVLLTAFYMTRQVYYVFFGESRRVGTIRVIYDADVV